MMAATKRIALGAVVTALVAGLAGCSGPDTGAGGSRPAPGSDPPRRGGELSGRGAEGGRQAHR